MVGKDKVIHLDQYRQSQVFEEAEGSLDWFDEENANASVPFSNVATTFSKCSFVGFCNLL